MPVSQQKKPNRSDIGSVFVSLPEKRSVSGDSAFQRAEEIGQRARFLRPKTYIEDEGGKLTVHCAGLPESCHPHVTWDNFHVGAKFPGKLYSKTVKGGIILYEGDFVIREETGL